MYLNIYVYIYIYMYMYIWYYIYVNIEGKMLGDDQGICVFSVGDNSTHKPMGDHSTSELWVTFQPQNLGRSIPPIHTKTQVIQTDPYVWITAGRSIPEFWRNPIFQHHCEIRQQGKINIFQPRSMARPNSNVVCLSDSTGYGLLPDPKGFGAASLVDPETKFAISISCGGSLMKKGSAQKSTMELFL